jgi:hypothetical protein
LAEDLFKKIADAQIPATADDSGDGAAPAAADAAIGGLAASRGYDLARFFPDLRMAPILAAAALQEEPESGDHALVHEDYAAIVAASERDAVVDARQSTGSVAAAFPTHDAGHGAESNATFASLSRADGRRTDAPQQPAGPAETATRDVPGRLSPATPRSAQPPRPGELGRSPAAETPPSAATPAAPATPVVPPADALLADGGVPPVPDLRQQLPAARDLLARSNLDNQRANWSDAPNIVGDGCAPTGSPGKISVGRICIVSEGLSGSPLQNTSGPATINVLTQGQFNNVQAIKNAGYPVFTLPAQPLGQVAGTPPTSLTTTQTATRLSHTGASRDSSLPSVAASSSGSRSLFRRISNGCVSGSPRRQLYSSTRGPWFVSIRPA